MATIEELEQRSEEIANAEAAAVAWLVEAPLRSPDEPAGPEEGLSK